MDFPDPMADDLFYSGASLNLAKGGDLSNPLLARQHFPGHLFLIYPPVHPYVLGWWLKVFGISAAAITGFQALMYVIIAAATILYLRRQGAPVWVEWLAPLGVMSAFMSNGLRPEALAVALTMAGFAVMECSSRGIIAVFAGYFLMALGAATAPRVTLFSGVLMLFAGRNCWHAAREGFRDLVVFFAAMFAGVLVAFLFFLWLLDFHLGDFWHAFRHYAVLVGGSKFLYLYRYYKIYVSTTQLPVFPLAFALLLLAWRAPWTPTKWLGVLLLATLLPQFMIGGLGNGTIWFVFLSVFALAAHLSRKSPGRSRTVALASALAVVALLANFKTFMHVTGIVSGEIKSTPGRRLGEARVMRVTPEHTVLVDQFTARYVFDYRIPEGFIYYPYAMTFPNSVAILPQSLLPGDICLLGPTSVENLNHDHLLDLPVPVWSLGLKRWSFFREPREVYIIHANELRLPQKAAHN